MTRSDVPVDEIRIWDSAVNTLRTVEQRLGHEPFTTEVRNELLAALTAVDDAWEEHIAHVRAWAGSNSLAALSVLPATVAGVDYEPGDFVERRFGQRESRFGQIAARVREGYEAWYVACNNGDDVLRQRTGSAPGGAATMLTDSADR